MEREAPLIVADVPWRQIRGLGNLLRHAYDRVDLAIIWQTITDDLPPLKAAVVKALDQPRKTRRVPTGREPEMYPEQMISGNASSPAARREHFVLGRPAINAVFVLLAGGFWAAAYATEHLNHLSSEILKDIGVVVFSLALVEWLWEWLGGGDPILRSVQTIRDETLNSFLIARQSNATGLIQVAPARSGLENIAILELIRRSEKTIQFLGFTLYGLLDDAEIRRALLGRLLKDVEIKICLPDVSNKDVIGSLADAAREPVLGQLKGSWSHLASLHSDAKKTTRLSIATLMNGLPTASILRFDDTMLVFTYLRSCNTPDSPVQVLAARRPLFQKYQAEFDWFFAAGGPTVPAISGSTVSSPNSSPTGTGQESANV